MAEKPILFSSEMIRAIFEGRKTQTRRVVTRGEIGQTSHTPRLQWPYLKGEAVISPYGYGDIGDTLWVRETWQAQNHNGQWWHEVPKEDRSLYNWAVIDKATPLPDSPTPPKWIPSIFMPRWTSRITLDVVDVRVEQLQEISEDDALAEGVYGFEYAGAWVSAVSQFEILWDKINDKRGYSWGSNPWVWVVEFERAQK